MEQVKDKYDEAVEYLTAHPNQIVQAWEFGGTRDRHPGACLFAYAGRGDCGCLTMIRGGGGNRAETPKLTRAIKRDRRIPKRPEDITVKHLPVFARWQRRLDKELNRA